MNKIHLLYFYNVACERIISNHMHAPVLTLEGKGCILCFLIKLDQGHFWHSLSSLPLDYDLA